MEGRRTRGRVAAEKSGAATAAAEHVPQFSGPDEAEAEEDAAAAAEPWRRTVTESVLRRIMTIRPTVLRRQFGWRPHTGAPRIALSVDGQRLEAGGQEVMQFNKEGRDGFPWKLHWVGVLLDRLGPLLGDTLLLHKQHVDAEGVIHVAVSLERGPQGESSGSGGAAGIAAAARAAVGAAVALAPRPSASSLGSAWDSGSEAWQRSAETEASGEEADGEEAEQQQQEGEAGAAAAEQQEPPAKRRRSGRHGADDSAAPEMVAAMEGPSCRYCGRSYIYPGACARHEERCSHQHTGLEHQQHTEPGLDGPGSSSPNMEVLLAAVEQAEPALQAAAPAAAATEDSMAAAAVTGQPAAASSSPALAAHSAQAAQRRVDQALQAFEEAVDTRSPEGMLRPLRLLALVGHGGSILHDLLHRWSSLGLERQQQVFDAALVAAGQGAWPQLEARLQAALGPGNTPGR